MNKIKFKKIPIPGFSEGNNKHYKSFRDSYGNPGSDEVKDRPETMKEKQAKLKLPLPALSGKQRGFVKCVNCEKKRIIYGEKKLNKNDQRLLQGCLDSIDFPCGDVLLPEDDMYEPLRKNKVSLDRRKTCANPLEGHYYKKFDPVCSAFMTPLNPEQKKLYESRQKNYVSNIIPCCDI